MIERFAAEIGCLMDALGFTKANLLGQSWGSAVSAYFAAHHADRVEKLVLSGPHLSTPAWVKDCNDLLAELPQDIQDTIKRCEAEGRTGSPEYKAADDVFSKRHFLRCDPWPERVFVHGSKTNHAIYNAMWGPSEFTCTGNLRDMDLTPLLGKLSMPVLLICGEYDTARPETVKDFAKLMPNAQVAVIQDSGHVSYGDQNEAYLNAVRSFLT